MAITTNTLDITDAPLDSLGATKGIPWTPHDNNYLEDPDNAGVQVVSKGISFAGGGDITLVNINGDEFTIPNGALAAGVIHPIRHIIKINDTDTDATGIIVWI